MKYLLLLLPLMAGAKIVPPGHHLTDWTVKTNPTFVTLPNSKDGLFISDPKQTRISHLTLGDQCSTVDIEHEKVLENWHKCGVLK